MPPHGLRVFRQGLFLIRSPAIPSVQNHGCALFISQKQHNPFHQQFTRLCSHNLPYQEIETPVSYKHGMPSLDIMLPSRDERCQFTLRPLTDTVASLLDMVQAEDRGIETIAIYRPDGTKIARATSIGILLQDSFDLVINLRRFAVHPPANSLREGEQNAVDQVKELISELYTTMNLTEWQASKEIEVQKSIEVLKQELQPYEELKSDMLSKSEIRVNRLSWAGLGLMGVQFGILARLTWWEYSWDIMEPVTYFVTYGTSMILFGYYVVTRQEYLFPDVRQREIEKHFHKHASKRHYDIDHYNSLLSQLQSAENDLKRLRQPLGLTLSEAELKILLKTVQSQDKD